MAKYTMTAKELILTSGSSRGSQIKFYKDGYWYKIDESGPEGKAEELASKILSCSSLKEDECVRYESCDILYGGKEFKGCRSKDFLREGEMLFSYEKIYNLLTGRSLTEEIQLLKTPKEKIKFVADSIKGFCGLDIRKEISKNLTASMVLLETDRHLNNLAVISDKDIASFRPAPVFDNGASFLSNYTLYPPSFSVEDMETGSVNIVGKPFSADLEYQAHEAGFGIQFDFLRIKDMLTQEKSSRMIEIAKFQIEKYSKISELQMGREFSICEQMENAWKSYFEQPKEYRNGIKWNGTVFRPAEFDDLYLAQCSMEKHVPLKEIQAHFWKNCVEIQGYMPKYVKTRINRD